MEKIKQLRNKIVLWLKRLLRWAFFMLLAYLGILLIGLIPVNNDFEPQNVGIEIFVVSSAVHADIIVPVSTAGVVDWHEKFSSFQFAGDISGKSHVAFGWGDRGFFLETETWDDLKITTAANALLLPSRSCIHASFTRPEYHSDAISVTISAEQYQNLVGFINSSFDLDDRGKGMSHSLLKPGARPFLLCFFCFLFLILFFQFFHLLGYMFAPSYLSKNFFGQFQSAPGQGLRHFASLHATGSLDLLICVNSGSCFLCSLSTADFYLLCSVFPALSGMSFPPLALQDRLPAS